MFGAERTRREFGIKSLPDFDNGKLCVNVSPKCEHWTLNTVRPRNRPYLVPGPFTQSDDARSDHLEELRPSSNRFAPQLTLQPCQTIKQGR